MNNDTLRINTTKTGQILCFQGQHYSTITISHAYEEEEECR